MGKNLSELTVGIVGMGTVGSVMKYLLDLRKVATRTYDLLPKKCLNSLEITVESDIVFICLPTPQLSSGWGLDTRTVEGFFRYIQKETSAKNQTIFVIRSTVPIGFTRRMKEQHGIKYLFHSPEFLTERTAIDDVINPSNVYLGKACETSTSIVDEELLPMYNLYHHLWPKALFHEVVSETTEAIKLFCNAFYALKVTAFNELHYLCEEKGLNWSQIRLGMLNQGMINHNHTKVPGPDGQFGFGGKCLPKDLSEVASMMRELHSDDLFSHAKGLNEEHYRNLPTDK
jgi:nucleotide sugar dehydrogenase